MKKRWIAITLISLIGIGGIYIFSTSKYKETTNKPYLAEAVLYQDPNCGCCIIYANYLSNKGIKVKIVNTLNIKSIKEKYKISPELQSCHTLVLNNNYIVEGHVPFEAINKLIQEKPKIKGISLPGMPSGSPGMPGPKLEIFQIKTLDDGETFMEI